MSCRRHPIQEQIRSMLPSARPHLAVPVAVDPDGVNGPTKRQAEVSRGWRRTSRGLYLPTSVDAALPEQRIVEAAMCLPSQAAGLTGWAALRWRGATWFGGRRANGEEVPVTLLVGDHKVREQPGFVVSEERRSFANWEILDGVPVACAAGAVAFDMRYAPSQREAVVTFEMAAFHDLVSVAELASYLACLNGWTGVRQAREALGLLDENSWSPQESRLRLLWMAAGLPSLLSNRPIFDQWGRHIATPDLFEPQSGLAIEYDGRAHLESAQRRRDVARAEAMRRAGLEVVVVVEGEQRRPDELLDRLQAALSRARVGAANSRLWTTTPPSWWVPTWTVEQRRQLDFEQRRRILGHRQAA
ncbi:hypothetical protein ACLM5J_02165 [Nocardioides sp. Bht2]|uniref:hypothetical protein n=1 Tax=Nocardioides sp. Bht2 TaxID=3392297 RepID=UPI0039B4CE1B